MTCGICNGRSDKWIQSKVLNKYTVDYFKCANCGFIETESPYWLEEAYSNAIATSDIGLIQRNMGFRLIVHNLIKCLFNSGQKYLDYGGGYGMFVRMMRDMGHDFYRYDSYCENLFCKYFDHSPDIKTYDLICAFEVFEHLVDPIEEIEKMLSLGSSILFSTELQPESVDKDWWYFTYDTGQHVALYTYRSLQEIAKRFKMNLYSNKYNLHLLTKRDLNPFAIRFLLSGRLTSPIFYLLRLFERTSFLQEHYKKTLHQINSSAT